jgi:hypothetical protein
MLRTSNVLFNDGRNNETMFPKIEFLARQILGVVEYQIETIFFFLWLEYLPTLRDVICKLKI